MRSVAHKIANAVTLPAYNEIFNAPDLFDDFTLRQEVEDSPHKNTKTILLRGTPTENLTQRNWQESKLAEDTAYANALPECYKLAIDLMGFIRGKRLGSVMLVSLPPKQKVLRHRDEGLRARYYDRFHIIIAGSHIWKSPNDKETFMRDSQIWWVNNEEYHEVVNNSDKVHRVSLIVDINV